PSYRDVWRCYVYREDANRLWQLWPDSPTKQVAGSSSPARRKSGRKVKYDWDVINAEMDSRIKQIRRKHHGKVPENLNVSEFADGILDWCIDDLKWGNNSPSRPTMLAHVRNRFLSQLKR